MRKVIAYVDNLEDWLTIEGKTDDEISNKIEEISEKWKSKMNEVLRKR